jgi:ABC-type transport system involved in multi-copper enzyme maturation permease subunit
MTRIWAVATNTFREAVRDRVLHSIFFFAVLLVVVSVALREISIGDVDKVVRGTALAAIAAIGAIIAIFLGINLVWKEIDRKTIYTLASKPLPRWEILLGKYLGLWLTLAAEVGLLSALYIGVVGVQQGLPPVQVYVALGLLLVELTVLCAWATMFSTFAAPTSAAAYTLAIYVIGHFCDDLRDYGEAADSPLFRDVALTLYRVLPNLDVFNLRAEAVHAVAVPWSEVGWALVYGAGHTGVVLAIACWIFNERDFK